MPVDPSILMKYEDPPSPEPRRREVGWLPSLAVAIVGTAIIAGAFRACSGNLAAAKVFAAVAITLIAIDVLWIVIEGWNEDGVMGVFYRLRHPLGTFWNNDDRNSSMRLARWWLAAILAVSVAIMCATTPGLGQWLNPSRSRGTPAIIQP